DKLVRQVNELLERSDPKTCIFKAPTGSGKTIMMAEFLARLVENRKDGKAFSFIWAAPRKLHNQSKEKLENYYRNTRTLQCSNIEDLTDKKIGENEILFLNWESINKKDNVFVRENENDFNLTSIVENTLEEGREIILIIDESHHTASAENTKGLVEIMKPKITIEVSATPHMTSDYRVVIEFEDVRAEGMIKKEVAINPALKEEKLEGKGSDVFILEQAIAKRKELKKHFEVLGKEDINPLLLIQLSDRSSMDFEDKKEEIEDLLNKEFRINTDNGKLAIYLSEDKRNLENISKNDNEAEVLIFKQAIALGWDCPRAYILVLFREWHSANFSIQTVGRILRMPETQHYAEIEELNKGYVYTNIANNKIHIEEDIAKDYFTLYTAERDKTYKDIDLLSCHTKRQRETTRLNPVFINIFLDVSKGSKLKDKLKLDVVKSTDHIPLDGVMHLERVGTVQDPVEVYKDLALAKTLKELENAVKYFIIDALHSGGMFPEQRSVGRVCTAIYQFFLDEFNMNYEEKQKEIMTIVLSRENDQHFRDVINTTLREYQAKHPKKENELVIDKNWNITKKIEYNANYEEQKPKVRNSILKPYYSVSSKSRQYQTEKDFISFLDNHKSVEWWFKNGEGHGTFFAVPYTDTDKTDKAFYVDFIVKLKDDRIGLFDTKSGIFAKDAGPKSDGLQKYIKGENKKGKNLFGGIVIPQAGSFWVSDKVPYEYDKNLTGWEILEF
ncbi:MAG TPA: DEAD/DEAH box helicase, partial [Candidatus Brocadiaceae bacterium]